jgi:hypothetical protein
MKNNIFEVLRSSFKFLSNYTTNLSEGLYLLILSISYIFLLSYRSFLNILYIVNIFTSNLLFVKRIIQLITRWVNLILTTNFLIFIQDNAYSDILNNSKCYIFLIVYTRIMSIKL